MRVWIAFAWIIIRPMVTGSFEYTDEPLGVIREWEFLYQNYETISTSTMTEL
jgi:hypothetical protein